MAVKLKKVTMNLTERDIANTETLALRLHSRNKASAVSSALAITEGITGRMQNGEELMIKRKDGSMETLVFTDLGSIDN